MARLSSDVRRRQLVDLGIDAFVSAPYEAVSLDQLAHDAGLSKGLLYHYFSSKREFYVAVLTAISGDWLARFHAAVGPDATAQDRLRAGLAAWIAYAADHPAEARLFLGAAGDPAAAAVIAGHRAQFAARVVGDAGDDGPVAQFAVAGWVGFVEAATLRWLDVGPADPEPLRAVCGRVLVATLMAGGR